QEKLFSREWEKELDRHLNGQAPGLTLFHLAPFPSRGLRSTIIRGGMKAAAPDHETMRVASGTGDNRGMGSVADDPATDRPREWLALPGGGIRPVVSVPGSGGIAARLAAGAGLARLRPACRCGRPRLGSGRTCGSAECVAELRVQEPGR